MKNRIGYKHHATIKLDPEKEMEARIKAEEAELRKDKKRKMLEGNVSGSGKKKYSSMSARYLEESFDDEAHFDSTSLSNIKHKSRRRRDEDYDESSEDNEEQTYSGRKKEKRNEVDSEMEGFIVNDEEDDGSEEYEEEYESPQKKSRLQKKADEVY